ncbi:MAG: T9SS type A sorting domain-containing protein [Brumimicrobium sp.]|nr:T9SS type A sorting domain-containing protein [Brumimicrobium sp.]
MKIKNLLLFLTVSVGSMAFSQIQKSTRPVQTFNKVNLPALESGALDINLDAPKSTLCIDTIRYVQTKEQVLGASNFYNFEIWQSDNEAMSQKFNLNGASIQITGAEFFGGKAPAQGAGSVTVQAAVYNVDASNNPTTLIGSGTITISDTNSIYRQVNFASPITVSNNYAIVITPTSVNGIVRIVVNDIPTNQTQDENLSRFRSNYYTGSGGAWVSIPTLTGSAAQFPSGPYDFEGLISPKVSYTLNASFTTSPSQVCENDPVNFTNTSAFQTVLGNRMYSYQFFRSYFGLAAADSTYAYDMGDGSPIIWQQNPTHTYVGNGNFNTIIYNLGGFWAGCTESTTQTVTIDPLDDATVTYPQTEYCSTDANTTPTVNSTGTFSATPTGLVFANANTGEINISASSPGTYDITFTTSGTCPNTGTTQVTINTPPDPGFSYGQSQYCANASNAVATLDPGAVAGSFTASPTGLSINAFTGEITVSSSSPGSYTVTNTVAGSGGCPQQTATANVDIIALDNASFAYSSNTLCLGGTNETPTVNAPGSFSATPAGLNFADANTGEIDLTTSAANTYNVTYTTTGTCPNSASQNITLTSSPDATFSYSANAFCVDNAPESPSFPAGASAGTFSVSPTGLSINAGNGTITFSTSTPGNYDVTNTIAASGSCPQTSTTITVAVNALPNVDAGLDVEACDGDPITLTATGANTYSWNNGVTQGVSFNQNIGTVTYTVIGTDANGCENADVVDVTVHENPTLNVMQDTAICLGSSITLTANESIGTVSWDNSVQDGVAFTPSTTQTYTVTADNNGCTTSDNVTVTVNPLPTVTLGLDQTVCIYDGPVTLQGSPAGGIYSGTGVTANQFDPGTAGLGSHDVTYTYEDNNGCEGSDMMTFTVDQCASLESSALLEQITIMPNPATDYLELVLSGNGELLSASIISAEGKIIAENSPKLNANSVRFEVDNIAPGTYFVKVNTSKGQVTKKIIIQ